MFEWISSPEAWIALTTLIALEIVLGIDNIIFISILVGRLPPESRDLARRLGLGFAMLSRLALLFSLSWIIGLTDPWFTVMGEEISGRDVVLIGGGLFLLFKSTKEVHAALEGEEGGIESKVADTLISTIIQIAILDIVFSLDSVITAVGLVDHLSIMVIAIIVAVLVMMFSAKPIGDFIDVHPTLKMLALSFLMMIGLTLIAEGFDVHVPKGYIYFAMAFSVFVEFMNIQLRKKIHRKPPASH
jgi:predicted tellurium resistance membrane protein TerC